MGVILALNMIHYSLFPSVTEELISASLRKCVYQLFLYMPHDNFLKVFSLGFSSNSSFFRRERIYQIQWNLLTFTK